MSSEIFVAGTTYDNVYFLFVDAAGYSSIVSHNPRDRAAHAFDLLRKRVVARVNKLAVEHRCARTSLWSWRGDGGFLVIHDENESIARDVALEAGTSILALDLPHLQEELRPTDLRGELHIRVAIHKGPVQYSVENDTGAIHSSDINFAAHLEEATPRDCLAISEDVHRVSGRFADLFEPVGIHENENVYLMQLSGAAGDAKRTWLRSSGLAGGVPVHAYCQRPSQHEKARLVEVASHDVVDLGTALNTCAGYLLTTERPALYREAVLAFLGRGGTYRCVLLDPGSETTRIYSRLRQEDLSAKINGSLAKFARFKERHGEAASALHVYLTREFPGMAALCVDRLSPQALILYSPYLLSAQPSSPHLERADMPHYLATTASGELFTRLNDVIANAAADDALERIL
jgi:class 3 adenylate cyclase